MRKRLLYLIILSFLLIGIGCTNIFHNKKPTEVTPNDKGNITPPAQEQVIEEEEKIPLTLYFPDKQTGALTAEKRMVPRSDVLKNVEGSIVAELIKGPEGQNLTASIPQGTKLIAVSKENGVVMVDLSKEFVDNHSGGSSAETGTIYSIVDSLTELKDIDKVRFLVEGQQRKEYKGHYQFDIDFDRNEEIIKKN